MASEPTLMPAEHEETRRKVKELRDLLHAANPTDAAQAVANYIVRHETRIGSKFIIADDQSNLMSAKTSRSYQISPNRQWDAYLCNVYGLNGKDKTAITVTKFLECYCTYSGEPREIRRWAA